LQDATNTFILIYTCIEETLSCICAIDIDCYIKTIFKRLDRTLRAYYYAHVEIALSLAATHKKEVNITW
jgi:hypothetical protein